MGLTKTPVLRALPAYWTEFRGGLYDPALEVETGVPAADIDRLGLGVTATPHGFHLHPKVEKLLEERRRMSAGERPIDFGMAEALAFASLVERGIPVRLSGQDSRRGTFNHRHAALIDVENEAVHLPLAAMAHAGAFFEVYDSMLSEAAVLGFEYGFSRDYPEALVLWEAQFGDFANGAQIVIDQFLAAAEDKWQLLSGSGAAAAARLRRPGPRALLGAHRALPAARRRRQSPGLPAVDRGAVFPPAAPAGAAQVAQAAHRLHPEVDAAQRRRRLAGRSVRAAALRESAARIGR